MKTSSIFATILGLCISFLSIAQDYPTDYLSPAFHADRRAAVKKQLSDKASESFLLVKRVSGAMIPNSNMHKTKISIT